jgi:hypothetical protein
MPDRMIGDLPLRTYSLLLKSGYIDKNTGEIDTAALRRDLQNGKLSHTRYIGDYHLSIIGDWLEVMPGN